MAGEPLRESIGAPPEKPLLSIVVVVYRMSRQAENTLFSLSPAYQRNVSEDAYEVIVVENASDDMLGEARASAQSGNVRYLACTPSSPSPVESVAAGVAAARGDVLAIIIDGARLLTPRVLCYALAAFRVTPHAMVTVPGYHLGSEEHHRGAPQPREAEAEMLQRIDWRRDGYRLFTAGVMFRGRHQHSYLRPMLESNCLVCSRTDYDAIGGIDLRFDLPGGGMANLDLYRRIGELPATRLFVLPGEGTFHQFHGGVTTRVDDEREALMERFKTQYATLRGGPYRLIDRRPTLLGAVTGWAIPALRDSVAAELDPDLAIVRP